MIAMAKASTMVSMTLVLSLLAMPAIGIRREGFERDSFSSEPLNPLDHRPAGLVEVEAGTGGREIEKKDECDNELFFLGESLAKICSRHRSSNLNCPTEAKNTIEHMSSYYWHIQVASTVFDEGKKTPVFWAGFWPGGKKGIDTREALDDFISSVNGFQLVDTEWGQAAESKGAKNLEACTWDRQKNWWRVASLNMAKAMALHNVPEIIIALHKTLHGKRSIYKTVLYQAELRLIGLAMRKNSTWNPQFEVRSIPMKGAAPHESGCALAPAAKAQLKRYADRPVTVWCRACTTLQACGPKREVEEKEMETECIEGDCQNGQGTMTWADGIKYQGQWKNGKRDGQGTQDFPNGDIYQGGWKNGFKEGQGTYTFFAGDKYQGEYKKGMRDGQGTYTSTDGSKYQGQWKNSKKDGQGTQTMASGAKYQGEYKKGKEDGQGTYSFANGNKYRGQWKNSLQDGQGTLTEANGNKYQGQWKNGLQDGQGTYKFANGNKYQGGWKNGEMDGQGTYTLANGRTMYQGLFKNGVFRGPYGPY